MQFIEIIFTKISTLFMLKIKFGVTTFFNKCTFSFSLWLCKFIVLKNVITKKFNKLGVVPLWVQDLMTG